MEDSRRVDSGTELGTMVGAYWLVTRVEMEVKTSRMVDSMLIAGWSVGRSRVD